MPSPTIITFLSLYFSLNKTNNNIAIILNELETNETTNESTTSSEIITYTYKNTINLNAEEYGTKYPAAYYTLYVKNKNIVILKLWRYYMSNPWKKIELSDYENHMSLENVYQLQILNKMMQEQFETYDINTIMILGIAGGNGLEHIDKSKIKKVYGIDVNQEFLIECKKRYKELGDVFETICTDLLDDNLQLPCSDFLVANLLVEYIGYECFQKIVRLVKPLYISCIIQINTGDSFVSDSPYIHAFDCLEEVHHQMEEKNLIDCMAKIGYQIKQTMDEELPNGKKFIRLDFIR